MSKKNVSNEEALAVMGGIREAVHELELIDGRRARVVERRDGLIARGRELGITWVELGRLSRLTPRGVQLALERARGGVSPDK